MNTAPFGKECVQASKDAPKRDVLKIFRAMTTNWNMHSGFWGDFFEGKHSMFWCGYEKKNLVMWFYAQSSYVTIWEKRESPDISNSIFKGGNE